ncbi:MAG TPA: FtsX-like permease family protein, partial [Terriglobales bacterium]|nr:FtsX-like permease family protein [Terriglobales bacterium]
AVISQTMARQYFPNGDGIGSQIRVPELKGEAPFNLVVAGSDSWLQIIGITGDVRDDGLSKPIKPQFYVPYTVMMPVWTQFLVRTQVEPLSILREVRQQIQSVDPDQQTFHQVNSLEQWIANQQEYAREHMIAFLFAIFAVLALGLAAVGLYSVVSYSVAQRTGEFGIRIALGARRTDVLVMVFQSAATSVGVGVLTGLVAVLALNRVLASWIQGSSRNPAILLGVSFLLVAVASIACTVPARRASSIDPMEALRHE